jgi:response regulator NasT
MGRVQISIRLRARPLPSNLCCNAAQSARFLLRLSRLMGRDGRRRNGQRDKAQPTTRRTPGVRILLADDDTVRAGALIKVLSADPSLTILRLVPGELLADAVAAQAPDVVLVDMARPDRDALEGIRVVTSNTPIVLFVDQDDAAFMEEAIRAGVSSYNVPGVPPPDVKPILRAAAAMFRHHQTARAELREAETRLREREIIDRAKAVLIKERRMSEPDAYRWLRTRAMATARRIPDVAKEVVAKERERESGKTPSGSNDGSVETRDGGTP